MAQTEPKVEIFSNQQPQEVLEVEIFSNQWPSPILQTAIIKSKAMI